MADKVKRVVVPMELSPAEANFVKRARLLTPGTHLVILVTDREGLTNLIVMARGNMEDLKGLTVAQVILTDETGA